MGESVKYVLDANTFIEAHRRYYSFDLVPAFWSFLIDIACVKKCIISVDKIYEELVDFDECGSPKDKLAEWTHNEAKFLFYSTQDRDVLDAYRQIMGWALEHDQFKSEAKEKFADDPDAWIIAYAKAHGFIIVTHESYEPEIKREIKIPNVCEAFGVEYVNTFDVLRKLRFFVDSYSSDYLE